MSQPREPLLRIDWLHVVLAAAILVLAYKWGISDNMAMALAAHCGG